MAKTTRRRRRRRRQASQAAKGTRGKAQQPARRGGGRWRRAEGGAPARSAPARCTGRHAAPPPPPDAARPTALAIAKAALDKKAEDVTVLDVRGLTSYADYFVVVTADSDRQASAIADHVEQTMKEQGVSKVGRRGLRDRPLDPRRLRRRRRARDEPRVARLLRFLEGLWADAPRFQVEA